MCDPLQMCVSLDKKPEHMPLQKQPVCDIAQQAERGRLDQCIRHNGSHSFGSECMDMPHRSEGAAHHFVYETMRAIKMRHTRGQPLANSEMNAFKGDFLAQLDPSRRDSANCALLRVYGSATVNFDVSRHVEADRDGSIERGFHVNRRHNDFLAETGPETKVMVQRSAQ